MVLFESGYSLPSGDMPLTHARIAHANNWADAAIDAVSTEATGYDAESVLNSLTYESWKPTSLSAYIDLSFSSQDVDYVCIGAHTLGTNSNSISVQYWTGSAWTTVISLASVQSDEPIFCIFEPVTTTKIRVNVIGGTAPTIGIIRTGEAMQMERPIYGGHSPINMSRTTTMTANISETGEWLGQKKVRTSLTSQFSWSNLTAEWVRTYWPDFQKAIEDDIYFIAWRPETFSEVALCKSMKCPSPSNSGTRDLMSVSLESIAYAWD